MHDLLPPLPLLSAFLVAAFVLAVTPGPGVFYIVTRSATQGRGSGLTSVAAVALGNLCNAIAAALGLAALFAASTVAFSMVKYLGAAYLLYLGIQALRAPRASAEAITVAKAPLARVFRDGLLVALFHPKTTLFFAAFLPQFVSGDSTAQSITLGVAFVIIAACTDTLYALMASSIAPRLNSAPRTAQVGRYLSAVTYFGLGILALFTQRASLQLFKK